MKNSKQIMDVALPTPEAADITVRAAKEGMHTDEYLGILVLSGAYGISHPLVKAFHNRPKQGQFGPKTQEGDE